MDRFPGRIFVNELPSARDNRFTDPRQTLATEARGHGETSRLLRILSVKEVSPESRSSWTANLGYEMKKRKTPVNSPGSCRPDRDEGCWIRCVQHEFHLIWSYESAIDSNNEKVVPIHITPDQIMETQNLDEQ